MPHITKYSEKMQCLKKPRTLAIPSFMCDRLKELTQQYSYMTPPDKCTIFNLIEEVIENTMKSNRINGDFFNKFVDVKEVP